MEFCQNIFALQLDLLKEGVVACLFIVHCAQSEV